jgi:hypothetical protein
MAEGGGFLAPGSGEGVHRRVHLLHAAALEQRAVRGFLLFPKNFLAFVTSLFPISILYSATYNYTTPPPSLNRFSRSEGSTHLYDSPTESRKTEPRMAEPRVTMYRKGPNVERLNLKRTKHNK